MKARDLYNSDYLNLHQYFERAKKQPDYCPALDEIITNCGLGKIKKKQLIAWLKRENINFKN